MIVNRAALQAVGLGFSTVFNAAFEGAESFYQLVAMTVPSKGRSIDYKWLGDFPMLREWIGDRVISDLSAHHFEIVNKRFESTIEVDRDDIEDDNIELYAPVIAEMGQAAKQHPDILVWGLLPQGFSTPCYDGQYFFDSEHPVGEGTYSNTGGGSGTPWFLMDLSRAIKPMILQMRKQPEFVSQDRPEDENVFLRNKIRYGVDDRKNVGFGLWQLAYGSKDTLDVTNYKAARQALTGVKDENGNKLGIRSTHLIVGSSNEEAGREIVVKENLDGGEGNIWKGTAELVVVPWLD
jgi:phage major head subunit gpT-like protein